MEHLFDTDLEKGLAAFTVLMLIWQIWICLQALALLRAGHANVRYGIAPLLAALVSIAVMWVIQ